MDEDENALLPAILALQADVDRLSAEYHDPATTDERRNDIVSYLHALYVLLLEAQQEVD